MSESNNIYETTCRFCGLAKYYGNYLFNDESVTADLLTKIELIFSPEVVFIEENDNLTKFVCFQCEMTINYFSQFLKMVKDAQRQLKEEQLQISRANQNLCHTIDVLKNYGAVNLCIAADGSVTCQCCQATLDGVQLMTLTNASSHATGAVFCYCFVCGYKDEIKNFKNNNSNSRKENCNNLLQCPSQCMYMFGMNDNNDQTNNVVNGNNNDNNNNNSGCSPFNALKKSRACDICGKQFRSTGHLNRHKLTHFNVKPFACPVCDMKFSQKSVLQTHSLIHQRASPFNCKWCCQSFRHKTTLQEHMINYHGSLADETGRKTYECDRCRKCFISKVKLERHYRSHSGEQPFKCYVCNKHFSQKTNLKTHSKKHAISLQQQPDDNQYSAAIGGNNSAAIGGNNNSSSSNSSSNADDDLYNTAAVTDSLLQNTHHHNNDDNNKYLGEIFTIGEPLTLDSIQLEDDNNFSRKISSNSYGNNDTASTISQVQPSSSPSPCDIFYDVPSSSYAIYDGADLIIDVGGTNSKSSLLDTFCAMNTDTDMCI